MRIKLSYVIILRGWPSGYGVWFRYDQIKTPNSLRRARVRIPFHALFGVFPLDSVSELHSFDDYNVLLVKLHLLVVVRVPGLIGKWCFGLLRIFIVGHLRSQRINQFNSIN
jgi:hypothetical protein